MIDCISRDILVTLGVPQDSQLGPLCFMWVVNEFAQIFEYLRVLFYANNMKLFLHAQGLLENSNRSDSLELIVGKCKSITFSRYRGHSWYERVNYTNGH
jgi:hypothetical protein